MNRKQVALLASVVLALLGTVLLVGYVHTAEAKATQGDDLVAVLVAADRIEPGTAADTLASKVRTQQVPAKVRVDGAVTDVTEVAGKVAAVELLPGEQLTASRFVTPAAVGKVAAPADLLETTVSLEPYRAVGGQIAPGQTVAVVITVDDAGNGQPQTHLVLHKVKVTAVQVTQAAAPPAGGDGTKVAAPLAPTGNVLVTLALDAPSVERVVWAAEKGHLWLATEPESAKVGGTGVQSRESVLR